MALKNKLLTWDNLQKRGWIEPSICALCCADEDSVQHLFCSCAVWKNVLFLLSDQYHFSLSFQSDNLCSFLEKWIVSISKHTICYVGYLTLL